MRKYHAAVTQKFFSVREVADGAVSRLSLATIFVPWLILVFCQKDYTFFVWLLLLYGITWLTRELLEPKLLGDGLGLLPVCFLISVIVGLKLFGAVGLFTGPFGILFVKELWTELEMWDSLQTPSASRCGDEKR